METTSSGASPLPVTASNVGLGGTVGQYLQLWTSLASLYYADLAIKKVFVQVGDGVRVESLHVVCCAYQSAVTVDAPAEPVGQWQHAAVWC